MAITPMYSKFWTRFPAIKYSLFVNVRRFIVSKLIITVQFNLRTNVYQANIVHIDML